LEGPPTGSVARTVLRSPLVAGRISVPGDSGHASSFATVLLRAGVQQQCWWRFRLSLRWCRISACLKLPGARLTEVSAWSSPSAALLLASQLEHIVANLDDRERPPAKVGIGEIQSDARLVFGDPEPVQPPQTIRGPDLIEGR
jgi:hypothetical protein